MTTPGDPAPRLRFTLGEVMAVIAAVAVLLAGAAVGYCPVFGLVAFLIVSQVLLRLLIAALPALGSILLGAGSRRELSEESAARLRDETRAAMALCAAGRHGEALQALLAAESIRSGGAWNAIAQAWCLRRMGRLVESTEPLERAAVHRPSEPLLHYALACHWSLAGSAPRALDSLSMALELDPDLRECAAEEPDFEAIRGEADYLRLVGGSAGES